MSDLLHSRSDSDYKRQPDNQGALLNYNNLALRDYKAAKKRLQSLNNVEQLEQRVGKLETMLSEILELLRNK